MNRTVIAETFRRQINVASVIFLALLGLLAFSLADVDTPGRSWRPMLGFIAVIAGAQLIGPEFNTGTLQLVLAKPVNRSVYLVSRVIGVWLAICAATWLMHAVEVSSLLLDHREPPWRRVFFTGLNDNVDTLLIMSLLALLGAVLRMHFNFVIYLGVSAALVVSPMILTSLRRQTSGFLGWLGAIAREHPGIETTLATIEKNLYPQAPGDFNRDWLLMVLCNSAVALFLASLLFRRREVPYGGD